MEPYQHDSPLSYEQNLTQPKLQQPSSSRPNATAHHALRLIWHLCQLCNLTASNISSYLTLEALARETGERGLFDLPLYAYPPAMAALAMMLHDMCHNLDETRQALLQTTVHQDCIKQASYRSLIDAANGIALIVKVLPRNAVLGTDGLGANVQSMLSAEEVEKVRKAFDEITTLCQGDSENGITGWHECFNTVKQLLDR